MKGCFNCAYGNQVYAAECFGCKLEVENLTNWVPKKNLRICKILAVEVGEFFSANYPNKNYERLCVHENGTIWAHDKHGEKHKIGSTALCYIINHPDVIKKIPRLTEKELEICRALGAKWVSRNEGCRMVHLWKTRPSGNRLFHSDEQDIGLIDASLFPSVKDGTCICAEESYAP